MTDSNLLAQLAASFLTEAYGSKENAIAALESELAVGDLSSVRAGAIAGNQKIQTMGKAMVAKPGLAAQVVHTHITETNGI